MNPRSITDADRQLAKRLTGNLTEINSILAGWDRLIPAAVIGAAYRGDGYSPRGDGGRGSGISDPTAGQMSSVANALELGAQLFGGQLGYPGEWPRMLDYIRTVDHHLRELARTMPQEAVKASTCAIGLDLRGVASWGTWDGDVLRRCDDLVHADGLCARHWSARRRWQEAEKAGREFRARGAKV